jgi:hypothetical protein
MKSNGEWRSRTRRDETLGNMLGQSIGGVTKKQQTFEAIFVAV